MGIDIYTRWRGQTAAEEKAQCTGWSTQHGHVGYLREAYHGAPYATELLVPEAFEDHAPEDGTPIPAATLRARLPEVLFAAMIRKATIYRDPEARELLRWVGIEPPMPKGDGSPVQWKADEVPARLAAIFAPRKRGELPNRLPIDFAAMLASPAVQAGLAADPEFKSFIDFVELCERKERETGEPVRVVASY